MSHVKLLKNNKKTNVAYLKFSRIFTPYLSRPEHAGPWYFINILQIIPNYISFLPFDFKYLLVRQNLKQKFNFIETENCQADSLTSINIPAKINPLNLIDHLKPDLQSQQHKRAWKGHTLLARLHSDNNHRSP